MNPDSYPCFNREMADRLGVDFDNTPLQPIVVPEVTTQASRGEG
jgi:hypothetical protein